MGSCAAKQLPFRIGQGGTGRDLDSGYRYETTSLGGFVQQIAVSYVPNGYYYYAPGQIPEGKDPRLVDAKLLRKYAIARSKWSRYRQKQQGRARVQYLRWGQVFVLLATDGEHELFEAEAAVLSDFRRRPLKVGGYSIGCCGGHAHVRIDQSTYRHLKASFLARAVGCPAARLEESFRRLRFEPYQPVFSQVLCIVRAVTRVRRTAGLGEVSAHCVRRFRRIYRPFEPAEVGPAGDLETLTSSDGDESGLIVP
jgi:hypothetical protein